jgi:hypothetical protein
MSRHLGIIADSMGIKPRKEISMIWIVFKDKTRKELLSYTAKGTFPGEMEETKNMLAFEAGITPDDIIIELQERYEEQP